MNVEENNLFLSPAPAPRPCGTSRKLDDPVNLNVWCFFPEIPLRFETPIKEAGDPMLQTFDVNGDEGVQVLPEGREESLIFFEAIDKDLTPLRDMVHGFLNSHPTEFHKNDDHIPSLPARLFDIVRDNVLLSMHASGWSGTGQAGREEKPTFDQETISLAIS